MERGDQGSGIKTKLCKNHSVEEQREDRFVENKVSDRWREQSCQQEARRWIKSLDFIAKYSHLDILARSDVTNTGF